jgi:hypothetical protein
MDLYKLAWLIWIGGTILVVLSWDGTVSAEVGWVGFVTALIGVGLSFIPHIRTKLGKPTRSPLPRNDAEPSGVDSDAITDRPRDERFFER